MSKCECPECARMIESLQWELSRKCFECSVKKQNLKLLGLDQNLKKLEDKVTEMKCEKTCTQCEKLWTCRNLKQMSREAGRASYATARELFSRLFSLMAAKIERLEKRK